MPDPRDPQADRDDELIVLYLDGQLDEQSFAELNDRMADDPAFRNRFIDLTMQAHHLQALVGKPDLALVQDELLQVKPGPRRLRLPTSYKLGLAGAVAAVLLLAVTLLVVLTAGNDGPEPIAEDNSTTSEPDRVEAAPVVAMLTAEHDAVWEHKPGGDVRPGALRPGTQLAAGQRLILTQGFAEITTNRGTIATIEAPATIELIDHDNAIRLHAGKLVGLCRTESSKGFVVKTRYADIVDLGTEFGVELRRNRMTTTVFTGEVEVAAHSGTPRSVTTKQTAKLKVDGNSRSFTVDDRLANGFDKLHAVALTKTATLPGTGQAIAVGQADPHWSITAIDGKALPQPVAATVADPAGFTTTNRENMRFMPNTPASKWITPLPHDKPSESVEYQTTFDASGFDLDTLSLELRLLADQRVTEIELNGQPVDVPTQGTGPAFVEMTELTLREGFLAGQNTLNITVQRYRTAEHAGFWTGLRAELELTSQRPSVGPNE